MILNKKPGKSETRERRKRKEIGSENRKGLSPKCPNNLDCDCFYYRAEQRDLFWRETTGGGRAKELRQ